MSDFTEETYRENAEHIGDSDRDMQAAIDRFATACKASGGYMPAIATRLRIIADEYADRYPDDANGGRSNH